MSRRLLQRGRYPKDPGVEQITNANPQNPSPAPSIPYSEQNLQPNQVSWNQPSYLNSYQPQPNQVTHQPAYLNSYQPNPAPPYDASQSAAYWSAGTAHSETPQNAWNYRNYQQDNTYAYSQQTPTMNTEHWQQEPFSQTNNQNYPQQEVADYNQASLQGYQYPGANQSLNNNPNGATAVTPLPTWGNGEVKSTELQQQNWNPNDYANPSQPSVVDFQPGVNPEINQQWSVDPNSYPSNTDYHADSGSAITNYASGQTDYHAESWPAATTTYLHANTETLSGVSSASQSGTVSPSIEQNVASETESVDLKQTSNPVEEKSRYEASDFEHATSTLSAFFQDNDQDEQRNKVEANVEDVQLSSQQEDVSELNTFSNVTTVVDEQVRTDIWTDERDSNRAVTDEQDMNGIATEEIGIEECRIGEPGIIESRTTNFVQEEVNVELSLDSRERGVFPESGFIEEPINQEVPEPPVLNTCALPQSNQDIEEATVAEEPQNQQIPPESGQTSRSASSERERIVIRPREDSPFKPPRPNSSKGMVVQQEVTTPDYPDTKYPEDKTFVHEVNLETFPDNLERPSDFEELRKESPLYASQKRFRQERSEVNNSPSSLLCDDLDIPCVTLVAAPMLSSAKSDRSDASSDSKSDIAYRGKSDVKTNEVTNTHIPQHIIEPLILATPREQHTTRQESMSAPPFRHKEPSPPLEPQIKQYASLNNGKTNFEPIESGSSLMYLKDTKINGRPVVGYDGPQQEPPPPYTKQPESSRRDIQKEKDPYLYSESKRNPGYEREQPERDPRYEQVQLRREHETDLGYERSQPGRDRRLEKEQPGRVETDPGYERPQPGRDPRYEQVQLRREHETDLVYERSQPGRDRRLEKEQPGRDRRLEQDQPGRDTRYEQGYSERDPRLEREQPQRHPRHEQSGKVTSYEQEHLERDPKYDRRHLARDPKYEQDPKYERRQPARDPKYEQDRPLRDPRYDKHFEGDPRYGMRHPDKDPRDDAKYSERDPRYEKERSVRDLRYGPEHLETSRQRFGEQKYPSFDERNYYSERERSRPSSRASLKDKSDEYPFHRRSVDYSYPPGRDPGVSARDKTEEYSFHTRSGEYSDPSSRGDPRDYGRPSSRMSGSESSRSDRQGQVSHYPPYGYPQNTYPRNADYYQRQPNQRGYDYDAYQRDPYYSSYYDAYRYAYSNYNYGFYDELYRNDPRYKQYQEQCRQYYAKYGYDVDFDRSSAHSGRSSVNDISKDATSSGQFPEQDLDFNESEFSASNSDRIYPYGDEANEFSNTEADIASTPSTRLTPVKFAYAHPIARFSPGGLLITAIPNQSSAVAAMPIRIHNMQAIREEEDSYQELKKHQGPLVRGLTHKNDVIEFCSQKVKGIKACEDVVDRDSHILLWELMVLLLRQNGAVAGTDIAELLLRDHEILRPPPLPHAVETPQEPADVNDVSSQSHASSPDEGIVVVNDRSVLNVSHTVDVDNITRKFREFLLFGHKKDALEWAMKHGIWGHALFLANKMDLRTYANVMTRFANSLALNDPLQTVYQLMTGRQPLAVTNVADKRWGDWRPHLAMILSNPSKQPDVDSKSITTLGDTLAGQGCLCAAHFCYIMAQVEFGTFEQKSSKLVLLTSDHMLAFEECASNEAIQMTEIYEYAQSLANPSFMLVHLQLYKFLYALRLVEHGYFEEALHYCEIIAGKLQQHSHFFQLDFITEVFKLATVLKYHDPHYLTQGEYEDQDDPDWLKNLALLVQNFNNYPQQDQTILYNEQQQQQAEVSENTEHLQYPAQSTENVPFQNVTSSGMQNDTNIPYNPMNYYPTSGWNQQNNMQRSTCSPSSSPPDNSSYYQGDSTSNRSSFQRQNSLPSHEENETTDVPSSPVTQTPPFDYYSSVNQQIHESKPVYEASSSYNNTTNRERRDSVLSSGSRYSSGSLSISNKSAVKETQKAEVKKDKQTTQAGKTWLGGIFSRLLPNLPKGPNQMILPDDKNPTIVWDEAKSCWVNKDSNEDDESTAPAAPPTDMELMGSKSSIPAFHPSGGSLPPIHAASPGNSVPPSSTLPSNPVNKFQRPKTRGMRQNYVDILNTSGATKKASVLPEDIFPSSYDTSNSPKLFMPPPAVDNTADLESTNHATYESPQVNTQEQPETKPTPLMLDPAEFDARKSSLSNQRLTLGRTGRRTYPT